MDVTLGPIAYPWALAVALWSTLSLLMGFQARGSEEGRAAPWLKRVVLLLADFGLPILALAVAVAGVMISPARRFALPILLVATGLLWLNRRFSTQWRRIREEEVRSRSGGSDTGA